MIAANDEERVWIGGRQLLNAFPSEYQVFKLCRPLESALSKLVMILLDFAERAAKPQPVIGGTHIFAISNSTAVKDREAEELDVS